MARVRPFSRLRGAAVAAICAVSLAACGDEDDPGTIPQGSADALVEQLDQIETAVASGECDTAQSLALDFAQDVNDLPDDVDPEVREELVKAAGNLEGQTETQCEEPDIGATGETETTEPPVTEPTPEPEPEPEEPPADDDSDNGQRPPDETPGNSDPGGGSSGGVGND